MEAPGYEEEWVELLAFGDNEISELPSPWNVSELPSTRDVAELPG